MTNHHPTPGEAARGAGPLARLTPYELVFTGGDFESRVFPRIREEAVAEGVHTLLQERFDFLTTAADLVREMTPEDAPPDALEQYRALLYQAYHFWRGRRRLYVLEPAAARYLVEAAPGLDDWEFTAPDPSLYLQLPANLFWSSTTPDSTPEPVDGFFVTVAEGEDPLGKPFATLEVLVVLGIRRSRAGFSVIPLSTELGPGIAAAWSDLEERSGGDFSTVLPGGDMAGLYSILTAGEVFKLLGRAFWYVDGFAEALVAERASEPRDEEARQPPHTRLAHIRVTLEAGEDPTPTPEP